MRTSFSVLLLVVLLPLVASANRVDSTNLLQTIRLEQAALTLDYNANGNILAVAGRGNTITIIQPTTGSIVKTLEGGHSDDINSICFNEDDRLIASASSDGKVIIWDVGKAKPIRILEGHSDYVTDVDWSPDDELLISAGEDGRVIIWEAGTGRNLRETEPQEAKITGVKFNPIQTHFATSSTDGIIRVYNAENMRLTQRFTAHNNDATNLQWSRRSGLISSGGIDNVASIYNPKTKLQVHAFSDHAEDITSTTFSPDGTVLASSGADRTIRLWDIPTGRRILTLSSSAHVTDVEAIQFNPDGSSLASCSRDGVVNIWRTPNLEERLVAAVQTSLAAWREKSPFESQDNYEKRMKKTARETENIRLELEGELAAFYEENVDWRDGMAFRTYNADGAYFPITSKLFGTLKLMVSNADAPEVAGRLDELTFDDLNLRVRKGRIEVRRIKAQLKDPNRTYKVVLL